MNNGSKVYLLLRLMLFAALSCNVFPAVNAGTQDTLNVTIDMQTPIGEGWLDTSSEVVGLRGDTPPLGWGKTYAADYDGDGIYSVNILFDEVEDSLTLALKIKVDGTDNPDDGWQTGRNHTVTLYSGEDNHLNLKWDDEAEAPPSTITGHVEVIEDFLWDPLSPRNLFVYLPPDYEDSSKRYPVLYMHDGQNLFDIAAIGQEWQMDEAAQALIKQNEIEPLIIVGIGNTPDRIDEYTPTLMNWKRTFKRIEPSEEKGSLKNYTGTFLGNKGDTLFIKSEGEDLYSYVGGDEDWDILTKVNDSTYYLPPALVTLHFPSTKEEPVNVFKADMPPMGGKGDAYAELFVNKIKPFIDENFRTKPEKEFTAIGGSSLGGLISLYMGFKYSDTFGKILAVSPSIWWDDRWIIEKVNESVKFTGQKIWLDIGTKEGGKSVVNTRDFRDVLLSKGWTDESLKYVEAKGANHSERAWAARVPDMLRYSFIKEK